MKILDKDLKKGVIKLVPETTDDIWILYTIISEGDIVIAKTTREVKGDDGSAGRRVPMTLAVRVKHVEFQQFTERLRVRGIVVVGPERYGVKGHYHTLNIDIGSVITIVKEHWPRYILKRIERSCVRRRIILLIALDYDETAIAVITHQGFNTLFEEHSHLSGKESGSYEEELRKYLEKIANTIHKYIGKYRVEALIIGSPGYLKHRLGNLVKEKVGDIRIYYDTVSTGGVSGVYELSRRDVVKKVLIDLEIGKAQYVLDEFLKLLSKNDSLIAYGVKEVAEAVEYNAVDKLVVSERYLKHEDDELRKFVEEIVEKAFKKGADIVIAPYNSSVERQVDSLGGLIAILRYPLKLYRRGELGN